MGEARDQTLEILQDEAVVHSGAFPVFRGIDVLDVENDRIQQLHGLFQALPRHEARGLHGCGQTTAACFPQEGQSEFFLEQGLAARKGDAAAGRAEEDLLLFHFLEHGIHGAVLTIHDGGMRRTGRGTLERTVAAQRPVDDGLPVTAGADGLVRAGPKAAGAFVQTEAAPLLEGQLRPGGLGFGVAAPAAGQGTAFQEDIGTDAGAVMHGIVLDVENDAGHLGIFRKHHWFSSCG